jgi:endonuclease/exonuclease/phosphatase family metal-dependent hydrolase
MRRFVTCLVLVVAACGDDAAPQQTSLVTYNLGLASGFVDYAAQRRPVLIELVSGFDADVVCLQEVWTQDDVTAVIDGTKGAFPYSHHVFLKDTTPGPPACTDAESDPLAECIAEKCPNTPASEIAGCALEFCNPEFGGLSPDCVDCVVANIGKEVEEILSICKTSSTRFAYEGANGLILLSRLPLTQTAHETLTSTNVQRSVLGARVNLPGLGDTAIVCTHLSSDLTGAGVNYNGPHGSWAGENGIQAEAAVDFTATFGADAKVRVIMGDMNSGPAYGDAVKAEIPTASYQVYLDEGYVDFPSTGTGPDATACTYCNDNTLVRDPSSVQIDRIVLSSVPSGVTASVSRVGTETVQITVGDAPVTTHPSDHFGVRLALEKK